jgi:Spy/CpxP family protein refolding chaperone
LVTSSSGQRDVAARSGRREAGESAGKEEIVKKAMVVAVALVAAAVTLTAFRHAGFAGHGRDPAQMAQFVKNRVADALDDVDATPQQRQQVGAIVDQMIANAQAAHQGQAGVHQAFLDAWKAETPDAAQLHQLVDQRVDAMRALAHQAVDAGVQVHGILTPAQRQKIATKLERRIGQGE